MLRSGPGQGGLKTEEPFRKLQRRLHGLRHFKQGLSFLNSKIPATQSNY